MRAAVDLGRVSLDEVRRAWLPLLEQSDRIADGITLSLLERDAHVYENIGADLRSDVRESTRVHIRRGLEVLTGRRPVGSKAAIEVWRQTGRRRARQGIPLELVLNAYTMGARMLWEALVAHTAEAGDADGDTGVDESVLLRAGQIVWSNLDVQNVVLIDAYRRESARLQRAGQQRQQSVLDGLLDGRGADPEFAAEAREVLDIDPEEAVGCVVALIDGALDGGLSMAEDRLARLRVTAHWHVRGVTYVGLLAGAVLEEQALADVFSAHAESRVGLYAPADGLAGFATAFQLATRAAETLPRHEPRVVTVSERLPEMLLAGSPHVAPLLLRRTLGPLLAQPEPQARTLLETLAALLRHDGSPTHAAQELFCHRNTVIYRLKQIEELTGRSLASPRDKLLLELALMAADRTTPGG